MKPCPYRIEGTKNFRVCRPMTEAVGEMTHVGPVDCDIACGRAEGPPSQGGKITDRFVQMSINRVATGQRYRATTVRRHLDASRLYVPELAPAIREAYKPLRSDFPLIRFYFTGSSVLSPERPKKDLDIAAIIPPEYLEKAQDLRSLAPQQIDGIPTDTFFMVRQCAVYWLLAFDLSEAIGWDPDNVVAPFALSIKKAERSPLALRLKELADKLTPAEIERSRKRFDLNVGDEWDPAHPRNTPCCDPPEDFR